MANVAPMNLRQVPTAGMPQAAPEHVDISQPVDTKPKDAGQVIQIDLTDGGVRSEEHTSELQSH